MASFPPHVLSSEWHFFVFMLYLALAVVSGYLWNVVLPAEPDAAKWHPFLSHWSPHKGDSNFNYKTKEHRVVTLTFWHYSLSVSLSASLSLSLSLCLSLSVVRGQLITCRNRVSSTQIRFRSNSLLVRQSHWHQCVYFWAHGSESITI